jgi:hypothetical protein
MFVQMLVGAESGMEWKVRIAMLQLPLYQQRMQHSKRHHDGEEEEAVEEPSECFQPPTLLKVPYQTRSPI